MLVIYYLVYTVTSMLEITSMLLTFVVYGVVASGMTIILLAVVNIKNPCLHKLLERVKVIAIR